MAFSFTVDGWQDWEGNRHEGPPDDLDETQGSFVHAWDPQDPENEHYFWTFVGEPFETWEEWWVLIGALMDMHGMTIA